MWTLAGLVWWNSRTTASNHSLCFFYNYYEGLWGFKKKICLICVAPFFFFFLRTCYHEKLTHLLLIPTPIAPTSTQQFLTFCLPHFLHLPSSTLSLSFALCCCKAFPWLAVINLPSPGAGSWLRARKRSYKAKTAIQKQSRFSCFQSGA